MKLLLALSMDITICVASTWFAFFLRLGDLENLNQSAVSAAFLAIIIALPVFVSMGLYKTIFRYSEWSVVMTVGRAMVIYSLIYLLIVMLIDLEGMPRTIGVLQPLILFFGIAASRISVRLFLGNSYISQLPKADLSNVIIYGAGSAGRQLVGAIANMSEMQVVAFVDDDDRLHGRVLSGFPIYAPNELSKLIHSKGVTHVLLAIPSVSRSRQSELLQFVSNLGVVVRTLPSVADLAEGRVTVSDIKDLDIDDLLGRDSVAPNRSLLTKKISGKTVLVTGVGGSIGSELCRQIVKLHPTRILLVEISEYALYGIYSELEDLCKALAAKQQCMMVPLLASVQDEGRMREIIDTWRPDTVYHAAAYKHVPLVEHNLAEGLKNNVIGTLKMAKLAIEKGVSDFVLISTDKAVRPTNVMGASKRIAELCLQALHAEQMLKTKGTIARVDYGSNINSQRIKTKLSMVRFGNVLNSSGSVMPRFRKQIRDGGPITLTHPEITRYFMTIPEAAQLVIQASAMAKGGDVFVLDMGTPVKIADLARRMIELSGLTVRDERNPEGDIEIVVTGLRPGEKLYEELLLGDDPQPTQHSNIQRARDTFIPWSELELHLDNLQLALGDNDVEVILSLLQELVYGYKPNIEIVDWVYREQSRLGSAKVDPSCATEPLSNFPRD